MHLQEKVKDNKIGKVAENEFVKNVGGSVVG
jgi:hypothetical protein